MSVVTIPAGSPESAYANAALRAKSELRAGVGPVPDPQGSTVIELQTGPHQISSPGALLGNEGMTQKGYGLTFTAKGPGTTTVVFSPAVASALMSNTWWYGINWEGIRFVATTPGCTVIASNSGTHAAQNCRFTDCTFEGFKFVEVPVGDNNNSEWVFDNCSTMWMQDDGAWVFTGLTGTSDQFLNYHWGGVTRHWGTSAPLIDAAKGGHFSIEHLDASNWGRNKASKLFNLRGGTHNFGVCSMKVNHLRAEIMNAAGGLLYSEWPIGNIAMDTVDLSSQVASYAYGETITLRPPAGLPGATLGISNSTLVGTLGIYPATPNVVGTLADLRNVWFYGQTNPFTAPAKTVRAENCFSYANSKFSPVTTDLTTPTGSDMFTAADRQLLTDARNAAVDFSWTGYRPFGVADGNHPDRNGNPIPKGLPLTPKDYLVQKFGPA